MAKDKISKLTRTTRSVERLLYRYFVKSGLVQEREMYETFGKYAKYRSPVLAGACTIKELRNKIEPFRRTLLLRLLGHELAKCCSHIGQRQDASKVIQSAIMLSRLSARQSMVK